MYGCMRMCVCMCCMCADTHVRMRMCTCAHCMYALYLYLCFVRVDACMVDAAYREEEERMEKLL